MKAPGALPKLASAGCVDVVAAGAALVDVTARIEPPHLAEIGVRKGFMTLVETEQARCIYRTMNNAQATFGGAAANTAAALAALGVRVSFLGKTADDELGKAFASNLRSAGVEYSVKPASRSADAETGRSFILVTPDSERTMCTNLGASRLLDAGDIPAKTVEESAVVYVESFLLDREPNRTAFGEVLRQARQSGVKIALSLSDRGCVERHFQQMHNILTEGVDILFANEEEIIGLMDASSHAEAVEKIRGRIGCAALTRGPRGVVAVAGDETHVVPADPVDKVVGTAGAGDIFAAGFLHGLIRGYPLLEAARMGTCAAAEVIKVLGARPESNLGEIFAVRGWHASN